MGHDMIHGPVGPAMNGAAEWSSKEGNESNEGSTFIMGRGWLHALQDGRLCRMHIPIAMRRGLSPIGNAVDEDASTAVVRDVCNPAGQWAKKAMNAMRAGG